MSNPGKYSDFNKVPNDLLGKIFPKKAGENTWGVELDMKPTKYQSFNSKIISVGGKSSAEVTSDTNVTDFGLAFKTTYKTAKPSLDFSVKVSDRIPIDGLSGKVHFDASNTHQSWGLSAAYEHKYVTANGRVFLPVQTQIMDFAKDLEKNKDKRFEGDILLTHPDYKFVAGGSSKVRFPENGGRKTDEYAVSVGYRDGKLFNPSVTFKQVNGKDKDGKDSVTKTVTGVISSKPADAQYVAQVDYTIGTKKTSATLGCSYPLDDGATIKAKLNSNKEAGIAYSKALSSSSKLDFGTLFVLNTDDKVKVESSFNMNVKFTQ
jgi:hypothetical protein